MKNKLVFIGNSIVNGFPMSRGRSFPGQIRKALKEGLDTGGKVPLYGDVINKGVNGETTLDILRRFDHDVLAHAPHAVFIMTGFMMTIPREVEEAAVIDGCNKYSMFFRIILPLSKSGLSTLAIYNGVSMWNEFAFANTLLLSANQKTLPLALGQFKGEHAMDMPLMLAVLVLSALPMIILFIIFQDKLVKGMMAGAVKG